MNKTEVIHEMYTGARLIRNFKTGKFSLQDSNVRIPTANKLIDDFRKLKVLRIVHTLTTDEYSIKLK